jgi:hypothetical protein
MADSFLVCIEDKRYLVLGKWAWFGSGTVRPGSHEDRFEGWYDRELGRRLTHAETARAIELFVAQSVGKTLHHVGNNALDRLSDPEEWHMVETLRELEDGDVDIAPLAD